MYSENKISLILIKSKNRCKNIQQTHTSSLTITASKRKHFLKHTHNMSTTIEATLTRELGIRFIDARQLATQARLQLGVKGYPSNETKLELIQLAMDMFQHDLSEEKRQELQYTNAKFQMVKDEISRPSGSVNCDGDKASCVSSTESRGTTKSSSITSWGVGFSKLNRKSSWTIAGLNTSTM